jgi:thiol-disulfide isomerase/thioredoxin
MNPPSLLLILIFSLIINLTKAQTKKETIEDCRNAYLIGNDNSIILTKPSFTEFRKCIIGKPFPSFSEIAISGKNYSSIDLQNKVVFINFWFTHCSPCLAELAILNEINKEYKGEDFLFLSFSTDTVKELKRFMGSHKIDYDVFS